MIEHADPDSGFDDFIGLRCPNCRPIVRFNPSLRQRVVEHISAHILYDPSVDQSSEPCGLCLRPASLCKIVLKKGKGQTGNLAIDMKASSCPNLVKFSIATAAHCSDASPCTNHPIVCPHCHDSESSPVIWSYNFQSHLLRKHPRVSLEGHSNKSRLLLTLAKLEQDGMKGVWDRRFKQQKVRRKSQRAPLVISETHRSRLVLKHVFLFHSINDSTDVQIHASEALAESDASNEDGSSGPGSDNSEAEDSDDSEDATLAVTETNNGGDLEGQGLEDGGERYSNPRKVPDEC